MFRLLIAALVLAASLSFASAQSAKIFVASIGNDANDGGRATPKRSFQAAHDAVAAGGEIVALDTAGYGAVSITKSVGIVVPPGVSGFITVAGTFASGVTVNAGTTDTVTLRGLIVEGPGSDKGGSGIKVTKVGALVVEDTTIQDFQEGVYFTGSVNSRLVVRGSAFVV